MIATQEILELEDWKAREVAHRDRLSAHAEAYRRRRSLGEKHPVEDFLFQYYPFSPSKLLSWHPGVGVALRASADQLPDHLRRSPYETNQDLTCAEPSHIGEAERGRIRWIGQLLAALASRPAQHSCLGLHEWAMVYGLRREEVRHVALPLRLTPEEIRELVDSRPLCCTHYDAYRFFTPEAAPANSIRPTLETRLALEQPGCIHTNMDLYKWAYKLSPWISGELLGDCFLFALSARAMDMRASPYDLRDLGYEPILIETAEGQQEYRAAQVEIAGRGAPLREGLRECVERLLAVG